MAAAFVLLVPANKPNTPGDAADTQHVPEVEDEYVGSQACVECHSSQYQSYLKTAHSRALADVDLAEEPADAEFEHQLSGRSYRVYRQDSKLRHREWLTDAPDAIVSDFRVEYLIGSGRHTRSYLVDDDGFLMESPITWYASQQQWALSPGFDHPEHWGFERAADLGCITCHVGRAEAIDDSLHRIVIHEQAIGCERCHGPGRRHAVGKAVAKQPSRGKQPDDADIVNPAMLPRAIGEAICAQCHLRADATVFLHGVGLNDIRPGKPLTDYRIDYRYDRPPAQMTVTGHVEQMRGSRCYQESDVLTCTTCHDPHAVPEPTQAVAYYRVKCLECHTEEACQLPLKTRREQADNCATCHMPQVATDIPHIAFTHHRIAVHADTASDVSDEKRAQLVPMDDVSELSQQDRERCLGLAYVEVAQTQRDERAHRFYRDQAMRILTRVEKEGLADSEVHAALARLHCPDSPRQAIDDAAAALGGEAISPGARVNALFVLADINFHAGDWTSARAALEQLVLLRRHSEDWRLLGLCRAELGDLSGGAATLEKAVRINPFRAEVHSELARVLDAAGHSNPGALHRRMAGQLKARASDDR